MEVDLILFVVSFLIPGFYSQHHRNWGWNRYTEGTRCLTPELMIGICTKLPSCPTIYNRFTQVNYLLSSHQKCGAAYIGDAALVCCTPKQRPPVDKDALNSAELCINPPSERGVCIPQVTCESLYMKYQIKIPAKLNKCTSDSDFICCPSMEAALRRGKLLTMEEGCGESFTRPRVKRIIGGTTGQLGNWPWLALLGYNKDLAILFSCGGVLVSDRHVVTAAHCVTKSLEFVRLGEHDLSTNDEAEHFDIRISDTFSHPDYNRVDHLYDIAVLRLYDTVNFTRFVAPICLPLTPELQSLPYVNTHPYVAGWGRTLETGSSATILQNIQIQVYDNSICKELYRKQDAIKTEKQFSEAVLCAGDLISGKDSCRGDSGGPIMMPVQYGDGRRFVLIGLVSYGIGCGRKDVPSVNSNVVNLISWIMESIGRMQ